MGLAPASGSYTTTLRRGGDGCVLLPSHWFNRLRAFSFLPSFFSLFVFSAVCGLNASAPFCLPSRPQSVSLLLFLVIIFSDFGRRRVLDGAAALRSFLGRVLGSGKLILSVRSSLLLFSLCLPPFLLLIPFVVILFFFFFYFRTLVAFRLLPPLLLYVTRGDRQQQRPWCCCLLLCRLSDTSLLLIHCSKENCVTPTRNISNSLQPTHDRPLSLRARYTHHFRIHTYISSSSRTTGVCVNTPTLETKSLSSSVCVCLC